jgi:hypothetical protein
MGAQLPAQPATVNGTFVMNGTAAQLTNVRAVKTVLDDGKKKIDGYAVLLSAKPATGNILDWKTAEPSERGSFILLMLEPTGSVWAAELGHAARKDGRFGVVTELAKAAFDVKGGRISGRYRTMQEEEFAGDRYTIDVTFDAPLGS